MLTKMFILMLVMFVLINGVFTENNQTATSNMLTNNTYSFTYKMAAKCKEYKSQHGYKYEQYFKVDDVTPPSEKDVTFEMHFAILAASNGHVLLSSTPEPSASDPVYEFVIGGGGNKFTEMRLNLRKNAKGSAITRGILSPIEFRAFYIKIYTSGTIEFGKEGDPLPLINYVDINPLTVRYFSFASWRDEAKYLFDCPVASANGTEIYTPDSQETEQNLTPAEKLKKSLLKIRSKNVPPASKVEVFIEFLILSLRYDAFASRLTTSFMMFLHWKDDGMAWNPEKFNDTSELSFKTSEIWIPSFIEASLEDTGPLNSGSNTQQGQVVLSSDGTMMSAFTSKFDTWCDDKSGKLNRWPNDEYTCQMIIEPWNTHEQIKLILGFQTRLQESKAKMHKGWEVLHTEMLVKEPSENTSAQSDHLMIQLNFKRVGTTYNIVFYVPLMVLMSFVLISFWTTPLTPSRVWFYAGSCTIISLGLSYVDYFIPCHTVPSILILYTCVLGGTLLCLVINVAIIYAPEPFFKGRYVQAVLTLKWFRSVFCLPDLKTCQLYETIDDDSNVEDSRSMMEAMQDEGPNLTEREESAEVIDKVMFTVYSLTFGILLACHY